MIWFQFLPNKNVLNSSDHIQVNKITIVKALFNRKMSEISKPLAWLRTTMCKPELSGCLKWKLKELFRSTLSWPSIWWVAPLFPLSTLLTCFCYLLSFCYLLAEWLAVNTYMCTDHTSEHVFLMKFTVVTAERWIHFLIFPPQCCDKKSLSLHRNVLSHRILV